MQSTDTKMFKMNTQDFINSVPYPLICTNLSYSIVYINNAAIPFFQDKLTNYYGISIFASSFFSFEDIPFPVDSFHDAQPNAQWNISIKGKKNEKKGILIYWNRVNDFCFFELKFSEENLVETEYSLVRTQYERLITTAKKILNNSGSSDIAKKVYLFCKEQSNSQCGFFSMTSTNESSSKILFFEMDNIFVDSGKVMPEAMYSALNPVIKNGVGSFINDFSTSYLHHFLPNGHTLLERVLLIPLQVENNILGLICLANKKEDYTNFDLEYSQILANIAAITIYSSYIYNDLLQSRNKAVEREQLKTAFLSNISHEIRTPMNSIIGFSDIMQLPGISDEKKRQYATMIKANGKKLLAILDDILDVAKLESGEIFINKSVGNINFLLADLKDDYKKAALENNLVLEVSASLSDNEVSLKTDFIRLRQIFNNLISNALKFTKKGKIEIGYEKQGNSFLFFVKDTGIGISKNQHEIIFERFRQLEEPFSRKFGGTGLGLSIAKAFVELLGGTIWLDSEIGKGSTFFFTVPFLVQTEIVGTVQNENLVKEIKKTHILIAEDDDIVFYFIQEVLQEHGYEILRANDGVEAVELSKNTQDISLVLMDLRMPNMDGYEAVKQIKKINATIPVIAHTAFGFSQNTALLKEAGFDAFLIKPANEELLIQTIKRFIKNI